MRLYIVHLNSTLVREHNHTRGSYEDQEKHQHKDKKSRPMSTESKETSPGSVQAAYAPSSWRAMEYKQANHPEAPFNPASQSVGLGGTCVPASLTISQVTPGLHICSSCIDFYLKPVSETGGKPGWLIWTRCLPASSKLLGSDVSREDFEFGHVYREPPHRTAPSSESTCINRLETSCM